MCKKGCSLCRVWPGVFNGHFSMSCDRYHLPPYDYYYYNASGAGGGGGVGVRGSLFLLEFIT